MHYDPQELWWALPLGYLATIAIETPVLLAGLSRRHDFRTRLYAGVWLTACTYPIVILVLPLVMEGFALWQYLAIAESFAPLAECGLFYAVWIRGRKGERSATCQDMAAVVLANLASFAAGEFYYRVLRW